MSNQHQFSMRPAARRNAKLAMAISGVSGSGKTKSALFIAGGLVNDDWSKVVVIDTERNSSELYADQDGIGQFMHIELTPPYSPDRCIAAIDYAEKAGMQVIIFDSMSHEWDGAGGCLQIKDALGSEWSHWSKVTPMHNRFLEKILNCNAHFIGTMRCKTSYVVEKNSRGKDAPRKVGLAPVQRDGIEYEFSLMLEINVEHEAVASKNRTTVFNEIVPELITKDHGKLLSRWLECAIDVFSPAIAKLYDAKTIAELKAAVKIPADIAHQFTEDQKRQFGDTYKSLHREMESAIALENQDATVATTRPAHLIDKLNSATTIDELDQLASEIDLAPEGQRKVLYAMYDSRLAQLKQSA